MARCYTLTVGPSEASMRLDRYLMRHVPGTLSRVAIQRAIRQGLVSVDGRRAKAHRPLRVGETVVARLEELPARSTNAAMIAEPISLEIIYEDAHLLVVNKPPGLVTHPAPGHWKGTLVNALAWHLRSAEFGVPAPASATGGPGRSAEHLPRMGIVHRLDKDTSGLLVVAKTDVALRLLAKQLKDRTMSRRYLALVEGHLPFTEGTVNAAIGRHHKDRKLMAIRYLGGRQAVTHYRVLKRFGEGAGKPPYTVLEVTLETGRTHQIRVHLSHLGHPVLGDPVYSHRPARYWHELGITRQLLHAYAIRFIHPTTQQPMELTAKLPEDVTRWIPQEVARRLSGTVAT